MSHSLAERTPYVWTQEGWLYLCVVIDLYSRAVIGWSMGNRIDSNLVCNALMMALWRRGFPKGVLVHSDRGSQYASRKYLALLKTYQLIGSMSRKGNCWDNACAESFFHTIKIELINGLLYLSREEAKQSIFEYIEMYYNKRRRHSTINYNTPEEFEKLNYSSSVSLPRYKFWDIPVPRIHSPTRQVCLRRPGRPASVQF